MAAAAFQAALDQVNASLRRNALVPAETLPPIAQACDDQSSDLRHAQIQRAGNCLCR